ncbi:MAG: HD-GYP domain-containing protein [Agathobacter sp.]
MQTGDRHLQKWESLLLGIVGVLMMAFSTMIGYSTELIQNQTELENETILVQDIAGQFVSNLFLTCLVSFVLSITIIVLIMQGNKRSYYYERVGRMTLQMVHALANTIDAKDSYTNGHSTRVAQYSVMLAKKMGYSKDALERVQYAALLHDIGKIGIPVEIINKPAKLTDEEYEIIKTHPVIGSNILNEITELPDISIGARYHHERYDGKGYPDHLKEMEIPEIARIVGVADAYDAMSSKRSYRDVLPQEVVRKEIEKGRDSQFDPKIADVMLLLMDEDVDYEMHE